MPINDTDFGHRSAKQRKDYMAAMKGLYGEKQDIPVIRPKKPKVKRRIDPLGEAAIQIKLVAWARNRGLLIHSVPNHGKRSYWTGQKEVAMGLLAGVADLFLAMPSAAGKHGYYIELKSPGNKPTALQLDWGFKVMAQNYSWAWFDNLELAQQSIMRYVGISE